MRIGRLRHRLEIQSATEGIDAVGATTRSYSTDETRWGRVMPLSGRELEEAEKIESRTTHKIVVRDISDIKGDKRIVHNTRNFNILNALDIDEKHRVMTLLCEEVVAVLSAGNTFAAMVFNDDRDPVFNEDGDQVTTITQAVA